MIDTPKPEEKDVLDMCKKTNCAACPVIEFHPQKSGMVVSDNGQAVTFTAEEAELLFTEMLKRGYGQKP